MNQLVDAVHFCRYYANDRSFPSGQYFQPLALHSRAVIFPPFPLYIPEREWYNRLIKPKELIIIKRIFEMNDIGFLVKDKRNQLKMTQPQLAAISGVGVRFISDLENGKPTMQIGRILEILHVLGLDVYISERGVSL